MCVFIPPPGLGSTRCISHPFVVYVPSQAGRDGTRGAAGRRAIGAIYMYVYIYVYVKRELERGGGELAQMEICSR